MKNEGRATETWREIVAMNANVCCAKPPYEDTTPCVLRPAHGGEHEGICDDPTVDYKSWSR